jgi:phosphatidylserine decarboxylase
MLPVRIPVAKEGVPFIGMSALATVVLALLQLVWPALALLAITGFVLCFFRDPERIVPFEANLLTAPADGKVIDISNASEPWFGTGEAIRISIFMNVFNCHVNRSPVSGLVQGLKYRPGRFMPADKSRAPAENEAAAMKITDEEGRDITVVQVAGLIARRIVCHAQVGDRLERGQRYGMIRFGSRLDVYIPSDSRVLVEKGDRTVAGQTVLAEMKAA